MAMQDELTVVEDVVITELRRSYPDEVTSARLQDVTGAEIDVLREVVTALIERGQALAGDTGWSWVDPTDAAEMGSPLPIPREAQPTPGAAEAMAPAGDDGQGAAVTSPGDAETPSAPEVRYEARVGVKIAYNALSDEQALALGKALTQSVEMILAESVQHMDVFVDLLQVTAFSEPRQVPIV